MTLGQFLIFWAHFVATHWCVVTQAPTGVGSQPVPQEIAYGGGCTQALLIGHAVHDYVAWVWLGQSLTSGGIQFP